MPSGEGAKVKTILNGSRNVESAGKGQAVSVQLDREIDISRGCVLQRKRNLKVGKCFIAKILWMDDEELVPGKAFYLKIGTRMLPANVQKVYYKIDVNTGHKIVANYINKNDLIECEIVTADNIVFDIFKSSRALGSLILIDRVSNMTSACGTVEKQIERYNNLFWSDTLISRKLRAEQKNQNPLILWFTGLSGSGKSTLANELEKILYQKGYHTMVLDGDNIRMGLNKDLGFDKQGRIENIRRIAEVSKLMNDAGLIVLTAFISPFMEDRKCAREIIGGGFIEIHVNTSLEICETRDVKGLYRKAREGSISDFTGVTSEYEMPDNPEITVDGSGELREALELLEREVKKFL